MVEQFRDTVPLNKGEQRQLVHYIDGVCNLTVETQWWYSIYVCVQWSYGHLHDFQSINPPSAKARF